MNGQYYLIVRKNDHYKFYWAPYSPYPLPKLSKELTQSDKAADESLFKNWGLAILDVSGESLKFQVLRQPEIAVDYEMNWERSVLHTHHILGAIRCWENGRHYFTWMAG